MSPERRAEIERELDAILGPLPPEPKPKPKPSAQLVASEGRVVRDAIVQVSEADPNARHRGTTTVSINLAAAERQYWDSIRDREADRAHRRQLDPVGFGHWGRFDD